MNKSLVTGLVIGTVAAAGVGALASFKVFNKDSYAEVVKVTPLTRTVHTPRQQCHDETVTHRRDPKDEHQVLGTLAGAVVGGVLGHQVGGGTGKQIATVAGAAAGGYAGNRIEKGIQDRDTYTTTEQQCETVYDKSVQPAGFEVRYRLKDHEGTVKMDHDPGARIPVRDGKLDLGAPEKHT